MLSYDSSMIIRWARGRAGMWEGTKVWGYFMRCRSTEFLVPHVLFLPSLWQYSVGVDTNSHPIFPSLPINFAFSSLSARSPHVCFGVATIYNDQKQSLSFPSGRPCNAKKIFSRNLNMLASAVRNPRFKKKNVRTSRCFPLPTQATDCRFQASSTDSVDPTRHLKKNEIGTPFFKKNLSFVLYTAVCLCFTILKVN
jgi:hypothetical protein